MDKWECRGGKSQRRERQKKEYQRREKIQVHKKVETSRNTVFFQLFCGSGWSQSSLAKAAGAEASGQMRDKQLRAVVAKHVSKSKCTKYLIFGALLEVELLKKCTSLWREGHGKSTTCSEHFWKLR